MSVRPGSGRGRDASLPTAMASKPVSGRTGQQQAQAAPAGRGREQQQQQKSRCPSLGSRAVWPRRLGCPALPCPVPVWQCACLPALDLFFSPYHGSLSVLLLLVVSFYVLFPFLFYF